MKKSHMVSHVNRDRDRFSVRRDSISAHLSIARLIISFASILCFKIATAYVKGAYMQSGLIEIEVYVLSPEQISKHEDITWKV